MLALIALVFIVVPLVEITVFVQVGASIGTWNTLALVIVVSVVGAWLTRMQGFAVLRTIQRQLAAGRVPGDAMIEGVLVLAGGLLLLTPGFVTDGVGLLLIFPPTRVPARVFVRRRLGLHAVQIRREHGGNRPPPDDVIDL